MRVILFLFWACFVLLLMRTDALALSPDQVLVLANKNARSSVGLAKEYMKLRGIPSQNLLKLWITDKEQCRREDYEGKVVGPVREYIARKDPTRLIRCIVTMYGLPIKVAAPKMTWEEKKELVRLLKKLGLHADKVNLN